MPRPVRWLRFASPAGEQLPGWLSACRRALVSRHTPAMRIRSPARDTARGIPMLSLSNATRGATAELLQQAVHHNSVFTVDGLRERAFTRAFQNLVYPQIWE